MARNKAFPKKLFVKIESIDGSSYFAADEAFDSLAELGERIRVGVYQLIETGDVDSIARSNFKPIKK